MDKAVVACGAVAVNGNKGLGRRGIYGCRPATICRVFDDQRHHVSKVKLAGRIDVVENPIRQVLEGGQIGHKIVHRIAGAGLHGMDQVDALVDVAIDIRLIGLDYGQRDRGFHIRRAPVGRPGLWRIGDQDQHLVAGIVLRDRALSRCLSGRLGGDRMHLGWEGRLIDLLDGMQAMAHRAYLVDRPRHRDVTA